ncbi:MAG: HlyD family secretion protein [Bacteroidales bacterium]|nr:HlyD family secretion protein [Bacteroidales bacterium]
MESKLILLDLYTIRAPSNGIVLEISGNTGEKVDKDKLLVKMSDLSTYKIECSVDNKSLEKLKIGGTVYAILDNDRLKGRIGNISPVINNKK